MPYDLVATDLDGTLLLDDRTVSRRTRRMLQLLDRMSVRHVVVTGRPASGCDEILGSLGYHGLAVCGHGAQIYDFSSRRLLSTQVLDLDLARSATEQLRRQLPGVRFAVLTAGLNGRLIRAFGYAHIGEFEGYPHWPTERLWDEPIEKVLIRHSVVPEDELNSVVAELCGRDFEVMHTGVGELELVPSGVDKGAGLQSVASHAGIVRQRTIAFGDMPNDIPMLQWAGFGVAMTNGHASLLAVADAIAPSNAQDGVAQVLESIFDLP